MVDKDYLIKVLSEALMTCESIQTRDGHGYPYTHFVFDPTKVSAAVKLIENINVEQKK